MLPDPLCLPRRLLGAAHGAGDGKGHKRIQPFVYYQGLPSAVPSREWGHLVPHTSHTEEAGKERERAKRRPFSMQVAQRQGLRLSNTKVWGAFGMDTHSRC